MFFRGVVFIPRNKPESHEFDLNVMKILINVYVQSQARKHRSPSFNWFISGRRGVCCALCAVLLTRESHLWRKSTPDDGEESV